MPFLKDQPVCEIYLNIYMFTDIRYYHQANGENPGSSFSGTHRD
jgi:hypothetical protein